MNIYEDMAFVNCHIFRTEILWWGIVAAGDELSAVRERVSGFWRSNEASGYRPIESWLCFNSWIGITSCYIPRSWCLGPSLQMAHCSWNSLILCDWPLSVAKAVTETHLYRRFNFIFCESWWYKQLPLLFILWQLVFSVRVLTERPTNLTLKYNFVFLMCYKIKIVISLFLLK